MESHTTPQVDEADQRASKRLKVDDSAAQDAAPVSNAAAESAPVEEQRVAVDEATKRVEPVPVEQSGEKADAQPSSTGQGDVSMTDAPATEKKSDGPAPADAQNGGAPVEPKKDDRDRTRGCAPIKAE